MDDLLEEFVLAVPSDTEAGAEVSHAGRQQPGRAGTRPQRNLEHSFAFVQLPDGTAHCSVCDTQDDLLCSHCVEDFLGPLWDARDASREKGLALKRQIARDMIRQPKYQKAAVQQAARLRKIIHREKELAAAIPPLQIEVAQKSLALEKRVVELAQSKETAEDLASKTFALAGIIQSGLSKLAESVAAHVSLHHWQEAAKVLRFYRIQSARRLRRTGVATIMDMPLPSTMKLWASMSDKDLTSSLCLAARAVSALALALSVDLPHPVILDQPKVCGFAGLADSEACIQVFLLRSCAQAHQQDSRRTGGRASASLSIGDSEHSSGEPVSPMGASDHVDSSELGFATAVSLLQANVVVLCTRSHVPVEKLHAERLLENLVQLREHVADCLRDAIDTATYVPLPPTRSSPQRGSASPRQAPRLQRSGSSEGEWEAIDVDEFEISARERGD